MQDLLDTVFRQLKEPLKVHVAGMIRDAARCEEICQETFLRAWEKRETLRGIGSIKGWIYRIATNLCLDELRSSSRRTLPESHFQNNSEDEEVWESFLERKAKNPFPQPEDSVLNLEIKGILQESIADLPEEKQELLNLVYSRQYSLKEAAVHLGIPYGTAKSRWHYAVRRLNTLLEPFFDKES